MSDRKLNLVFCAMCGAGWSLNCSAICPICGCETNEKVQVIQEGPHDFCGAYKGHTINLERDHPNQNWYIIVATPSGGYIYDGWWRDSVGKSVHEAVIEALRGSMLVAP